MGIVLRIVGRTGAIQTGDKRALSLPFPAKARAA